jgi:hypothetical protein
MTESRFFWIDGSTLRSAGAAPSALRPIAAWGTELQPALSSAWHHSFKAWADLGLSPGLATPYRIWAGSDGALAFRFAPHEQPQPISHVGQARELASWLVLLDKWLETSVVVARARAVWSGVELGGALSFTTPAFLPRALVAMPPDNWARVAMALAAGVATGVAASSLSGSLPE